MDSVIGDWLTRVNQSPLQAVRTALSIDYGSKEHGEGNPRPQVDAANTRQFSAGSRRCAGAPIERVYPP